MDKWKYKELFDELFQKQKVVVSSDITELIKKKYPECTDENARNIIRTAKLNGTMYRVEEIVVEHNSYLYCAGGLEYTKKDIKMALRRDVKFGAIIDRFERNKGIISYLDIFKLSGCSINKSTSHCMRIEQIIDKMNCIYSCRQGKLEDNLFLIDEEKYPEDDTDWAVEARKLLNQAVIECLMLRSVLYSLKRQNIVNDVVPLYRNEKQPLKGVTFNNLMFDAVAYSSVPALLLEENAGKAANTIVLFDIAIAQNYKMSHFKGYYDRIQMIKNGVKTKKRGVIPVIATMTIDRDVKTTCKNMGILTYQLTDLFGNKIDEILKKYENVQVLSSVQNSEESIASIADLLDTIQRTGQDDNLDNLRGTLFEYFMHSVIYKWLGGFIAGELITNKKIVYDEESKNTYEYDIIAPLRDEYLVIELKGYAGSKFIRWGKKDESGKIEKETLAWFFRQTLPIAQKKYKNNAEDKPVKACYITTAHFDPEAKQKIDALEKGTLKSKYINVTYNGNQLRAKLKELKMDNEVKVLDQFYFNS